MTTIRARMGEFAQYRQLHPGSYIELEARLALSAKDTIGLVRELYRRGIVPALSASVVMIEPRTVDRRGGTSYVTKSRRLRLNYPQPALRDGAVPNPGKAPAPVRAGEFKTAVGRTNLVKGALKDWKLAVSEETAADHTEPPRRSADLVTRVFYRMSFSHQPTLGRWRLDISVGWQSRGSVKLDPAAVQKIVAQVISAPRAAALRGQAAFFAAFELLALDELFFVEVEMEWDSPRDPTEADVAVVDKVYEIALPHQIQQTKTSVLFQKVARRLYERGMAGQRAQGGLKRVLGVFGGLSYSRFVDLANGGPLSGWTCTLKADGLRCCVVLEDGLFVVTERSAYELPVRPGIDTRTTIVEGELVGGRVHVYDVIMLAGQSLSHTPFPQRIVRINEAVGLLQTAAASVSARVLEPEPAGGADSADSAGSAGSADSASDDSGSDSGADSADSGSDSADSADSSDSADDTADEAADPDDPADAGTGPDTDNGDRPPEAVARTPADAPWIVGKEYVTLVRGKEMPMLKELWERSPKPFPVDGIVFTNPVGQSSLYTQTVSYKWKPPSMSTIDVLVRRVPPSAQEGPLRPPTGVPGVMYAVFVSCETPTFHLQSLDMLAKFTEILSEDQARAASHGSARTAHKGFAVASTGDNDTFPVQFSPPIYPEAYVWWVPKGSPDAGQDYHNQLCELLPVFPRGRISASGPRPTWKFCGFRPDRQGVARYWGNGWPTAVDTYNSVLVPLRLKHLGEGVDGRDAYFVLSQKDESQRAKAALHSFVKTTLYASLPVKGAYHLELGVGRGADWERIRALRAGAVLAVDANLEALVMFGRRVQEQHKSRSHGVMRQMGRLQTHSEGVARDTQVSMMHADLTADAVANAKTATLVYRFPRADSVSAQFVLTYMCGTEAALDNFFHFVGLLAAPDAYFILTYPDGGRVLDATASGEFKVLEQGRVKYHMRRKFPAGKAGRPVKLAPVGQLVDVKLPFREDYLEEFLVNSAHLDAVAARYGFQKIVRKFFDDMIPEFRTNNSGKARLLTPGDIAYAGLHAYVVYRMKGRK